MTKRPEKRRRPAYVTWLSLGVLTLAAVALSGLRAWSSLPDLPYAVPPLYLLIRNALWGVWGLLAAFGGFFGKSWAPRLIRLGGLSVVAWYWLDRLVLTQSEYARTNWLFAGLLTLAAIAFVAWVLRQPVVRSYFEERST